MASRSNSPQPVRSAIYTRQSVVRGGGDPTLASCVLQREKCLDFVRSHERDGWHALDERFDDEGYSGATVERPGLERLVERIARPSRGRGPVDENVDPFVLRGLLACGRCGRRMATATGARRTKRAKTEVPRYYRCRTPSCRGGQVIASEAVRLAFEAVSAPPAHWPDAVRKRLREFSAVWNDLWPINRRRPLGTHFAAMTWHWKPERLDVLLRETP